MKRGRHKTDNKRAALMIMLSRISSEQFADNKDFKRCKTPFCGGAGECLACGADQGEYCKEAGLSKATT